MEMMIILQKILLMIFGFAIWTVNAQGVVGGNDDNDQQECLTCLRGTCRTIKGIYTRPDLPPGYSLVVQIPAGSCGTYVQQIKHTRNLLALKISGNSTYILNGDWKFGPSRTFDAAGTKISYIKQDGTSLETIHAPGHLTSSLDIMIVNYQLNSGIKYRYSLPVDGIPPLIAPPLIKRSSINSFDSSINSKNLETYQNSSFTSQRDDPKSANSGAYQTQRPRHRRKNFHWKITGLTPCSKSCDGGTQNYIRTCYRTISSTHHIVINEKRCAHLESPALSAISCNTEPCINNNGFWDGKWGPCSVTCGEGVQQYHHQCKQEINGNVAAEVADIHCGRFNKPSPESRVCQEKECEVFKDLADNELPQVVVPSSSANNNNAAERKDWTVGSWSQCSHSCGTGHKSRSVICPSGQCHPEKRPVHVEYCNLGSCETSSIIIDSSQNAAKPTSSKSSLVPASNNNNNDDSVHSWLISDWSHCSVRCGIGNQTRIAFCETGFCNADTKPEISRACSSDKFCDAQWFAGPWGDCSDSCSGPAKQLREVLCIARIRGVPHVTNDMVCPIGSKPHEEQPCSGICPPQWFSGDWGKCEGNCPSGVQRRDVRCLDIDKRQSNNCPEDKIPSIKRPCACESRRNSRDNVTHKLLAAQDEPIDRSCVDRIQKCRLAVQARLCNYPFYTKNCCESCRKAQQDQIE